MKRFYLTYNPGILPKTVKYGLALSKEYVITSERLIVNANQIPALFLFSATTAVVHSDNASEYYAADQCIGLAGNSVLHSLFVPESEHIYFKLSADEITL